MNERLTDAEIERELLKVIEEGSDLGDIGDFSDEEDLDIRGLSTERINRH